LALGGIAHPTGVGVRSQNTPTPGGVSIEPLARPSSSRRWQSRRGACLPLHGINRSFSCPWGTNTRSCPSGTWSWAPLAP